MQTFKRGGVENRWAGTAENIAALARLAASLVSQVASRDMTDEARIQIDSHAYEDRLQGVKELEDNLSGDADLELIQRVSVEVGSGEGGAAHALVILQRRVPAAIYGIGGWDRTWVEGSATQLEEALAKRAQRHRWERWLIDPMLVVLGVTTGALLAISLFSFSADAFVAIGLIAGVLALLYMFVARLMQRYLIALELLPVGGVTRWERERRKALTLIGTGTVFLIGVLVTALATRLVE